jgi:serine/threonine-protein phosphatase 2B catalytic subunit
MGAIIRFVNNAMNIRQFKWVEHPYYLPNFMNVFSWSIPFIGDKVQECFRQIWSLSETEGEEVKKIEPIFPKDKAEVIKAKIMTIGRMAR